MIKCDSIGRLALFTGRTLPEPDHTNDVMTTRHNNKRWYGLSAALFILVLFAGVLSYVAWTISSSNMGRAGKSPGFAIAGELASPHLRSMEQRCTGVTQTRDNVWLIGRRELRSDYIELDYIPDDAINLGDADGHATGPRSLFGRNYLTTLARLQDDGVFRVVATVPHIACLQVSPDSETLYLFTWLSPPDEGLPTHDASRHSSQNMIFRSTDNGHSWEWLKDGFMADAAGPGYSMRPTFASDHEVWLWSSDAGHSTGLSHAASGGAGTPSSGYATSLFYSANAGQDAVQIFSAQPLELSDNELQTLTGISNMDAMRRSSTDVKRYIVQVDPQRAYAWISERAWYHLDGESSTRLLVTSRIELTRSSPQDAWQVQDVRRENNVALGHFETSADGQTHAILINDEDEWLVRLDTASGEWIDYNPTPALLPAWLSVNDMRVRYFWSNGDFQVISLDGYVTIPRILYPFTEEPAEISTDAHFYTNDGGRNWHQLAIPGYLGVMGLARHDDNLYWTKGDWYANDEPHVWRYKLAH